MFAQVDVPGEAGHHDSGAFEMKIISVSISKLSSMSSRQILIFETRRGMKLASVDLILSFDGHDLKPYVLTLCFHISYLYSYSRTN